MRLSFIAVILLSACAPEEDEPGIVPVNLGDLGATVYITGLKRFSPEEIAAGVKPSPAILAAAENYCPNASFLSATSTMSDPHRVGYFFSCP